MDRVLIFLSVVGAIIILTQWYVLISVRKWILRIERPISRARAYLILALLGCLNFVFIRGALHSGWFQPDSFGQWLVAVVFFSVLGCVLALTVLFLFLDGFNCILHVVDRARSALGRFFNPAARGPRNRNERETSGGSGPPHTWRTVEAVAGSAGSPSPGEDQQLSLLKAEDVTNPSPRPGASRRSFLRLTAALGLGTVVGGAAYGVARAYANPLIEEFDIRHPKLSGLDKPITLIQVTDFHFGMLYGTRELAALVERLNALEGEAVLITGDVFHNRLAPLSLAVPILRRLRPRPWGNIVVLGNHDFYTGASRAVEALQTSGLRVLRDEWTAVNDGPTPIILGGIDDPVTNWMLGKGFPKFKKFAEKTPQDDSFKILLSHRPNVLPLAAERNVDFIVSGHIHGGQVIVPFPGRPGLSIARLVSPYVQGWYSMAGTRLYLNRGVGLTFVPWRINCPAEIAVFHLHGENSPDRKDGDWRIERSGPFLAEELRMVDVEPIAAFPDRKVRPKMDGNGRRRSG